MKRKTKKETTDTLKTDWKQRATITEKEAQRLLNLCRTQIWRLRQSGKLGYCQQGTRVFYRPYHIDAYLDSIEAK